MVSARGLVETVLQRMYIPSALHFTVVTIFIILIAVKRQKYVLVWCVIKVCAHVEPCVCVCDNTVCGTRMFVRERTRVGMNDARRIDRF